MVSSLFEGVESPILEQNIERPPTRPSKFDADDHDAQKQYLLLNVDVYDIGDDWLYFKGFKSSILIAISSSARPKDISSSSTNFFQSRAIKNVLEKITKEIIVSNSLKDMNCRDWYRFPKIYRDVNFSVTMADFLKKTNRRVADIKSMID